MDINSEIVSFPFLTTVLLVISEVMVICGGTFSMENFSALWIILDDGEFEIAFDFFHDFIQVDFFKRLFLGSR